jgi:hypothetical protein
MREFSPQEQKELDLLNAVISRGVQIIESGSFSQRNPLLGKMVTCPLCRRRKRQFDPLPCCSSRLLTPADGVEIGKKYAEPSEKVRPAIRRKNPRLTRNNPPFFLIHQRLVELEKEGVNYDGLSGIVEAQIVRARKEAARKRRNQQKLSRRINRENS